MHKQILLIKIQTIQIRTNFPLSTIVNSIVLHRGGTFTRVEWILQTLSIEYTLFILVHINGLILYAPFDNCVFYLIMSGDISVLAYMNSTLFILFNVCLFLITTWIGLVRVCPLPVLSVLEAVALWEKCRQPESLEICTLC